MLNTKFKVVSLYNKLFFILIFSLCFGSEICNVNKNNLSHSNKYELNKLIEIPIADNYSDSSLYLLHSRSRYIEKNYTILEKHDFLMPEIPGPGLIDIDPQGNFYISNAFENIKVFDKNGKFIFKFDYPDRFYGYISQFDNDGNFYIFMNKENSADSIVYKINAVEKTTKILTVEDLSGLDETLFPPGRNEGWMAKIIREQGYNDKYFAVVPGPTKIKSIFNDINGRFVWPESVIVYLIDSNIDFNSRRDKHIFSKINFADECNNKVIYASVFKIDNVGNILISGLLSDETEPATMIKYEKEKVKSVKVKNLKFFVWKFVRE